MDENDLSTPDFEDMDTIEQDAGEPDAKEKSRDWESEASSMGWNPNYDGDDKIDAREYVLRKPIFDELRKLRKKARDLDAALIAQRQVQERLIAAEKREHEKQLRDLKSAKLKAVEDGDAQKVLSIDEEIETLTKAELQEQTIQTVDPTFSNWVENNQWYEDDPDMAVYANAIGTQLSQQNRNLTPEQVLEQVTAKVMKVFPDKFKNPRREKAQTVEANSPQRGRPKEDATLNPEQKRVARTQWRAGFFGDPSKVTFKDALKAYTDELRKAGMLDDEE